MELDNEDIVLHMFYAVHPDLLDNAKYGAEVVTDDYTGKVLAVEVVKEDHVCWDMSVTEILLQYIYYNKLKDKN